VALVRSYVVLPLLVADLACGGQSAVTSPAAVPSGWVSIPAPQPETEAANCANWARDAWNVTLSPDSSALLIQPARYEYADTVRVDGGTLTSVNRGEFGGEVYWEPTSGPRQRIAQMNLVAFVPTATKLLGLAGLAHMSMNEGRLVTFERAAGGSWSVTSLTDLGAAPQAFTLLRDTILVVVSGALIAVHPPEYSRVLHRNAVWPYTYAHAVVRDQAGTIYIGMRSAVARLVPDTSGFREDWLVPTTCQRRQKVSDLGECECRDESE